MSYYQLGELLKKLRKQKGLTQEDLCEGIISKTNLSRLENGIQMPQKEKLDLLFQRLGMNPQELFNCYLSGEDFLLEIKKDNLGSLISMRRNDEAEVALDELIELPGYKTDINRQHMLHARAAIAVNRNQPDEEIRKIVMEGLKITIPTFSENYISSYFLSQKEASLVNILALTYQNENNYGKTIDILYKLKESVDSEKSDEYGKFKTYPALLYNLSKHLGLAKRYHEAIDICNRTQDLCIRTNSYRVLPDILYNKAYCLHELGKVEECKSLVYQAYYGCAMMNKSEHMKIIKEKSEQRFGIIIDVE